MLRRLTVEISSFLVRAKKKSSKTDQEDTVKSELFRKEFYQIVFK